MKYLGSELAQFSEQINYAIDHYKPHGKKQSDFQHIIICGLGGSGISGRIIKNYFSDKLDIPVEVVSDYQLPRFVNEHSLVILCSYSGNTEETLMTYQHARDKAAFCLALTVGGKLADLTEPDGVLIYRAVGGYQPRVAFGYPITYLFMIFAELLGLTFTADLRQIALRVRNIEDYRSRSAQIRESLKATVRQKYVIIASPDMEGIAIRFAQQIQENAKLEAFVVVIPEANHNVIETYYSNLNSNYIMLNSGHNQRINYRFHFVKELIGRYGSEVIELPVKALTMDHLFDMIYLLDWTSIQLADEVEAVSNQIKNIIELKDFLNSK